MPPVSGLARLSVDDPGDLSGTWYHPDSDGHISRRDIETSIAGGDFANIGPMPATTLRITYAHIRRLLVGQHHCVAGQAEHRLLVEQLCTQLGVRGMHRRCCVGRAGAFVAGRLVADCRLRCSVDCVVSRCRGSGCRIVRRFWFRLTSFAALAGDGAVDCFYGVDRRRETLRFGHISPYAIGPSLPSDDHDQSLSNANIA